nr:hypothetical protein [Tanacetum cinerariifolium]
HLPTTVATPPCHCHLRRNTTSTTPSTLPTSSRHRRDPWFCLQSAVATQQWNSFALTLGKCTSSGITITSSGNALEHFITLTVGKCTSRGITITSSGNALEHFITLTVGKCTSRGITITSSGNVLEHLFPTILP